VTFRVAPRISTSMPWGGANHGDRGHDPVDGLVWTLPLRPPGTRHCGSDGRVTDGQLFADHGEHLQLVSASINLRRDLERLGRLGIPVLCGQLVVAGTLTSDRLRDGTPQLIDFVG
jgi:hypothetical protein